MEDFIAALHQMPMVKHNLALFGLQKGRDAACVKRGIPLFTHQWSHPFFPQNKHV